MRAIIGLVFALFFSLGLSAKEVHFKTVDKATIYAEYQKRGTHAIVLAHGAIFNKNSWGKFEQRLLQENYSVLAIDFRGYGKSTQGAESSALYADILAGVKFLKSQEGIGEITVLGASMGGAAAAKANVLADEQVMQQLILLSPANIYQPEKLKGKLLFIASEDEYLAQTLQDGFKKAPEPKRMELIAGKAHAQHIFKTRQAEILTHIILDFLKKN